MNPQQFGHDLQKKFEEYKAEVQKTNILIMGGTGVGKSSLINTIFGKNVAQAATGKPVTQELKKYESDNLPIIFYDTKGYEIGNGKEDEFINNVVATVEKSMAGSDPIHIVWYCIQASGHRFTDFDKAAIQKLMASKVPLAVVLTKSETISEEDAKKFKQTIFDSGCAVEFFETSSHDKQHAWQMEELCEWSIKNLPDAIRTSFIAAQKISLKAKRKHAESIIIQHVTGAAVTGFSPIPVSDAPILLGIQGAMVARIAFVYGLEIILKNQATYFMSTLIGPVIQRSGIMLAGSLLKLIPGIGTIAGGMINAGVAGSITYAVGYAFTELSERLLLAEIEGGESSLNKVLGNAADIFKKQFDVEMKKKR